MSNMQNYLRLFLLFICCCSQLHAVLPGEAGGVNCHCCRIPLRYSYDISSLESLNSSFQLSTEELLKWELFFHDVSSQHSDSDPLLERFQTYLAVSEREVAFLSHLVKHSFMGSFDPLIVSLTHLFFPDVEITVPCQSDAYSEALCALVFEQFQLRYLQEEENAAHYIPSPLTSQYTLWYPEILALFPLIEPPSNRIVPAEQFRQLYLETSVEEKEAALQWALIAKRFPGHKYWLDIANGYMEGEHLSLSMQLQIRAVLAMAMFDAHEWSDTVKWAFDAPRPAACDPTFHPLIPNSSNVSFGYPSGHAARAGAACEVLSWYFPDQAVHWETLAHESAYSRVWAGLHFPLDVVIGLIYGASIANYELMQG